MIAMNNNFSYGKKSANANVIPLMIIKVFKKKINGFLHLKQNSAHYY